VISNGLKGIYMGTTQVAGSAHSRKVQSKSAASRRLQNSIEQAAHKAKVEHRVLWPLGDALLQNGVYQLSRETIHVI
jgi:hypothetical protein